MVWACQPVVNTEPVKQVLEMALKLTALVTQNLSRRAMAAHNVAVQEISSLPTDLVRNAPCFHPLAELIHTSDYVLVSCRCCLQRPNEINPHLVKGVLYRYWCHFYRLCKGVAHEFALLAALDYVLHHVCDTPPPVALLYKTDCLLDTKVTQLVALHDDIMPVLYCWYRFAGFLVREYISKQVVSAGFPPDPGLFRLGGILWELSQL